MAGEEDIVIPAANAPLLAAAIEGAELRLFPGAGHAFIAQEAPPVACGDPRFRPSSQLSELAAAGAKIAPSS